MYHPEFQLSILFIFSNACFTILSVMCFGPESINAFGNLVCATTVCSAMQRVFFRAKSFLSLVKKNLGKYSFKGKSPPLPLLMLQKGSTNVNYHKPNAASKKHPTKLLKINVTRIRNFRPSRLQVGWYFKYLLKMRMRSMKGCRMEKMTGNGDGDDSCDDDDDDDDYDEDRESQTLTSSHITNRQVQLSIQVLIKRCRP